MKHLTIRNCPENLALALEEETQKRGLSLNQTVLQLLSQALGVNCKKDNGLRQLAGTWSEAEFAQFQTTQHGFSEIDPELWA